MAANAMSACNVFISLNHFVNVNVDIYTSQEIIQRTLPEVVVVLPVVFDIGDILGDGGVVFAACIV